MLKIRESGVVDKALQIGFLYVGPVLPIPQIMVASLKKSMPHARLVQMTDAATLPVPGVDEVIRKPQTDDRFMCYRLLHLRDFPRGNTVFLDVDVVVQRDLSPLFDDPFDVGLTYRDESDRSLRLSPEIRERMPFNTGVMMARASGWSFWEEAYEYSLTLPKSDQCWFGDQLAIRHIAEKSALHVARYPCALYNYSPWQVDEDYSDKYVVHYKGDQRKLWMLEAAGVLKIPGRSKVIK